MLVGHFGPAFAAKGRLGRAPLGAFVIATFAPDILRVLLSASALGAFRANLYSHALPWSAILTLATIWVAWKSLDDVRAALICGALIVLHVALDMLSGNRVLWLGGPRGLGLEHVMAIELPIEALLVWCGWLYMQRTSPARRIVYWAFPVALSLVQGLYLVQVFNQVPLPLPCIARPVHSWRVRLHVGNC
jgi:hypothetical protein